MQLRPLIRQFKPQEEIDSGGDAVLPCLKNVGCLNWWSKQNTERRRQNCKTNVEQYLPFCVKMP